MSLPQFDNVQALVLPGLAVVAALVALIYCLYRVKFWGHEFGVFDALLVVVALGALTAAAAPILDQVQSQAAEVTLLENLRTFRDQIERYKLEHGGNVPLLYQGGFPQLVHATDAAGVPGNPSQRFRLGPYFRGGIPANPVTGSNRVTAVEQFPPHEATGKGGWLYHSSTGRIAADSQTHLEK